VMENRIVLTVHQVKMKSLTKKTEICLGTKEIVLISHLQLNPQVRISYWIYTLDMIFRKSKYYRNNEFMVQFYIDFSTSDYAKFNVTVVPSPIKTQVGTTITFRCNVNYEPGKPRPNNISYKWSRIIYKSGTTFTVEPPVTSTGIDSNSLTLVRFL
jgi:hypothetical protein